MVGTHEVEYVDKYLGKKERNGTISKFYESIIEYVIDNDSKVVAFATTTTDKQKMGNIMQDENTHLKIVRHGLKPETNNNYIEG